MFTEGCIVDTSLLCSCRAPFIDYKAMMQLPPPVFKDIVLVGGGHANVHIIKMMGMNPQPGVRVTLITTVVEMPYSGMLPGYVAGAGFMDSY